MLYGPHTSRNRFPLVISLVIAVIVFLVTLFFNYLAQQDACCLHWGIFHSTTGNISKKYFVEITPSGWAFSIWGIIYTYQALWLAYGASLLFRKNPATQLPLYYSPVFMPAWLYISFALNLCLNVCWLLLWDREDVQWAAAVLAVDTVLLFACLADSTFALKKKAQLLKADGAGKEIGLVIGLVHNGLATYATWSFIATLLNLAAALIYRTPHWSQDTSSAISLGALAVGVTLWILLDHTLLKSYTTYLVTPYAVLLWALVGSVDASQNISSPITVFTIALLVLVLGGMLIKLFMVARRTKCYVKWRSPESSPLRTSNYSFYS